MKLLSLTLASLGLASAASVASPVSYDGWKVYRVTVGENKAKLSKVMSNLELKTWKGKVETSAVVDVVVPPTQIGAFITSTEDFNTMLMHDNLGDSIAEESTFGVYAKGIYTSPEDQLHNALTATQLKLQRLPMQPGSTHTTHSPTTSSGSQISPLRTQPMLRSFRLESPARAVISSVFTSMEVEARAPRRVSSGTRLFTRVNGSPPW